MKSAFRVVGGLDFDAREDREDKRTRLEDRKRAAPLIREWRKRVRHHMRAGYLLPIDEMVALELLNYPSANHGKCYAGRRRIADTIGSNQRTVDRALERLEACGLLKSRRGGPGKTATRFFCCNHLFVFGGKAFLPLAESSLDATPESSLDATPEAHKLLEQQKSPEQSLPLSPDHALDGEIIVGTMTFAEFWNASGKQGSEGFARSEWRKLKTDDVASISNRLQSDPTAIRQGVWSGTWLRDRLWLEARRESADEDHGDAAPLPTYTHVHAAPGSDLWRQERERKRIAGESLKLMDAWAKEGRGVTVRVPVMVSDS
jgi:hypothetical protein